ncbi:hypothetical protein MLD38_038777 [Melastoma candidum]|uniref:Uncharacterized protein n=1 Tax=Melastoma candidum TaxID=119954 RepID=A0ACB9L0N4_9MYRT|nr:hypothetical protein MLD38_038777 [Melastoma candidum]
MEGPLDRMTTTESIRSLVDSDRTSEYSYAAIQKVEEISRVAWCKTVFYRRLNLFGKKASQRISSKKTRNARTSPLSMVLPMWTCLSTQYSRVAYVSVSLWRNVIEERISLSFLVENEAFEFEGVCPD